MYLILTFLALCTEIARAQFDIPTAMMMGMEPQQAMLFMGSGSGTGGGTGGGMDGMGGGGMSGGGGGGNEFGQGGGQGNTRGGGNMGGSMGGAVDGMGGNGGGGGGNMEMPSGGGGVNRGANDRGNRFNRPNFNPQQNMGRFNMGGGGGGVGSSNNNMGGSNTMMSMMLCQETPSRFRELPCNLNNPQSCPMSQYLTCQSGVYFYPVCCAKDWRSLRIVDVMF